MSATVEGGKKAAKTIAKRYGVDKDGKILHYKTAGAKGGSRTHAQGAKQKGFAAAKQCDCELIEGTHGKQRCRGVLGGLKSRRTKAKGDK